MIGFEKAPYRYGGYQFGLFRWIFGLYLAWHFARLVPYATELFSSEGALPDPKILPSWGRFPNVLFWLDGPVLATGPFRVASSVPVVFGRPARHRSNREGRGESKGLARSCRRKGAGGRSPPDGGTRP